MFTDFREAVIVCEEFSSIYRKTFEKVSAITHTTATAAYFVFQLFVIYHVLLLCILFDPFCMRPTYTFLSWHENNWHEAKGWNQKDSLDVWLTSKGCIEILWIRSNQKPSLPLPKDMRLFLVKPAATRTAFSRYLWGRKLGVGPKYDNDLCVWKMEAYCQIMQKISSSNLLEVSMFWGRLVTGSLFFFQPSIDPRDY